MTKLELHQNAELAVLARKWFAERSQYESLGRWGHWFRGYKILERMSELEDQIDALRLKPATAVNPFLRIVDAEDDARVVAELFKVIENNWSYRQL
jgi:hypothetical protein